jgi:hypothetical protein
MQWWSGGHTLACPHLTSKTSSFMTSQHRDWPSSTQTASVLHTDPPPPPTRSPARSCPRRTPRRSSPTPPSTTASWPAAGHRTEQFVIVSVRSKGRFDCRYKPLLEHTRHLTGSAPSDLHAMLPQWIAKWGNTVTVSYPDVYGGDGHGEAADEQDRQVRLEGGAELATRAPDPSLGGDVLLP